MKGRKPTPANQHKLRGTYRPDRGHGTEPKAAPGIPVAPEWLDGAALDEWNRIIVELSAMETLAGADRALIVGYCECWGQWQAAVIELRKTGTVVRGTSGGAILSPFFTASLRLLKELRPLAAELGLSATSRARLRIQPRADESDEFDQFLGVVGWPNGRQQAARGKSA